MKYPCYTREQNLACKLSDEDISNIRKDYETALISTRKLAIKYNVAQATIMYWVNEDCRKKAIEREKQPGKYSLDLHRRKMKIQPETYKYMRERDKAYWAKHKDKRREKNARAHIKNRIQIREHRKKYYRTHKAEIALKGKLYREKNREAISQRRRKAYLMKKEMRKK